MAMKISVFPYYWAEICLPAKFTLPSRTEFCPFLLSKQPPDLIGVSQCSHTRRQKPLQVLELLGLLAPSEEKVPLLLHWLAANLPSPVHL